MIPFLAAACASPRRPRPVVPLQAAALGAVETYGPGLVATDDSGETIMFRLDAPAGVVVVRVWPGSRLEPLYPARNKDTTFFQAGTHTVRVRPPQVWLAGPGAHNPLGIRDLEAERCIWDELRRSRAQAAAGDTATRRLPRPPVGAVDLQAIEDRCRARVRASGAESPGAQRPGAEADYYLVLVASDVTMDAKHLGLKLAAVDISASDIVSVLQVLPGFLAGPRSHTWAGYAARVGGR